MNLNKTFLIGNLTRDPEMRTLPSGQPVASFGLATNRVWSKNGKRESQAEFHNIVAFGRLAEIASQYLTRGKMVLIEGRIQTRTWQSKDGTKKNRTEIVAERLQLGRRGGVGAGEAPPIESENSSESERPVAPPKEEAAESEAIDTIEYPSEDINPDEIPF